MFRAILAIAVFKLIGMLFRFAWRSLMFIIGGFLHLVAFLIRGIEAIWKQSAKRTQKSPSLTQED
jgi:hypothetical protein